MHKADISIKWILCLDWKYMRILDNRMSTAPQSCLHQSAESLAARTLVGDNDHLSSHLKNFFIYIDMNPPRVYMRSQTWSPLPPPSPQHPSGSSLCTSPKHAVSCIGQRLVIQFLHDSIHVLMPFSRIIPPSPSPSESNSLLYTPVSFLLSCIQGRHCHLSKFHIYVLVYCIGVFLSGLLHSV